MSPSPFHAVKIISQNNYFGQGEMLPKIIISFRRVHGIHTASRKPTPTLRALWATSRIFSMRGGCYRLHIQWHQIFEQCEGQLGQAEAPHRQCRLCGQQRPWPERSENNCTEEDFDVIPPENLPRRHRDLGIGFDG